MSSNTQNAQDVKAGTWISAPNKVSVCFAIRESKLHALFKANGGNNAGIEVALSFNGT